MKPDDDKRKISRRAAVRALGSLPLVPLVSSPEKLRAAVAQSPPAIVEPPVPIGEWRPKFLNLHQNESVIAISELIIPQTDTPGAKAARVNEYIDLVLSEENPEKQESFLKGLAWMDQKSHDLFGADFVSSKPSQQRTILDLCSTERVAEDDHVRKEFFESHVGIAFFEDIKKRTIFAYYTSREGIHQELQYKGLDYLVEFPGCQHRESRVKIAPSRQE